MRDKKYLEIITYYESCLERHGDTHRGVDWPNQTDVERRYEVMLDLIPRDRSSDAVTLLDFGCGAAHLYEYMIATGVRGVEYSGLDLSKQFTALAALKFPSITFYCVDLLENGRDVPCFDYVVMNGVFTVKRGLTFAEMLSYCEELLTRAWTKTERGLAFNVMSTRVDRERDDLFHVPFDTMASIVTRRLSRHFVIRHDYGNYDYTTYVYR